MSSVEQTQGFEYQCTVCHYVYEGTVPFDELPEDYKCPVCGRPLAAFEKQEV